VSSDEVDFEALSKLGAWCVEHRVASVRLESGRPVELSFFPPLDSPPSDEPLDLSDDTPTEPVLSPVERAAYRMIQRGVES
jgi:hypothetical protein